MADINGGRLLARCLANEGVRFLFGLPSPKIDPMLAALEGLAIKTVVFADGAWTMEEPNQLMLYGRNFGSSQGELRWDKVAEGLGCTGIYAERPEEVEPALARARDTDGPVVVCLHTDRDANRNIPADMMMRFAEVYQGPMG